MRIKLSLEAILSVGRHHETIEVVTRGAVSGRTLQRTLDNVKPLMS